MRVMTRDIPFCAGIVSPSLRSVATPLPNICLRHSAAQQATFGNGSDSGKSLDKRNIAVGPSLGGRRREYTT